MGFYLRKALRVGPFRFNLSKSGIGISSGIKGLRLGTGPHGNYVHMGRSGLYYRKTFPAGMQHKSPLHPIKSDSPAEIHPNNLIHESMKEIESEDIRKMFDSSSTELVEEMNTKRKKFRLWPIMAIATLIVAIILGNATNISWIVPFIAVLGAIATLGIYYYDQLRKTTVLFYELEPDTEQLYESLHDAYNKLAACASKWHVEAEGAVKDIKRTAGANTVVKRSSIVLRAAMPPYVKTNIAVPSIPVGKQIIYFFPDKILVFEKNGVGAVSYPELQIDSEPTRFIEDGKVPRDSKIVGKTWRYVNKKGGPDKRFKDNKELPIALYEDIHLSSSTGLNERIQVSRDGLGAAFTSAVRQLAGG